MPKREKPWVVQLSGYRQIFSDTDIYIQIYTEASIIERMYYSTMNGEMEQWGKNRKFRGRKAQVHIKF